MSDAIVLDSFADLGVLRKDPPFLRSEFNYDMEAASRASGLECKDESLTLQSQADEADINVLVRRFGVTGQMPAGLKVPTYQDFDGIWDYRSALDAVKEAEEAFMQVPADIRSKFDNDPGKFVEFCSDEANLEKLREMGLADVVTTSSEKRDGGAASGAPAGGETEPAAAK